jgi:hypothetical protein
MVGCSGFANSFILDFFPFAPGRDHAPRPRLTDSDHIHVQPLPMGIEPLTMLAQVADGNGKGKSKRLQQAQKLLSLNFMIALVWDDDSAIYHEGE